MTTWRRWLVRFGLWLAQRGGWTWERDLRYVPIMTGVTGDVIDAAETFARHEARAHATYGGEAKRHQVYARMIDRFPGVPHRDLALAIELAVRRLP